MNKQNLIPFSKPNISQKEIDRVIEILHSGYLTQGPETERFESEFANKIGAKYAVAVNSATAGLHLCLLAKNIGQGDSVIVPTNTYAASAQSVAHTGAIPLLVDTNYKSLLDPDMLQQFIENECKLRGKKLIHKKTGSHLKAIMPVHIAGDSCDLKALGKLCKKYNLSIVEDAAHAFLTMYKGNYIGKKGEAVVFSLYATKNITSGEGGIICTDSKRLSENVRLNRRHGIQRNSDKNNSWNYRVISEGFKYNMNDIAAAIGRIQLERSEELLKSRLTAVELYKNLLRGLKHIEIPQDDNTDGNFSSAHLFQIRVKKGKKERERLMDFLKENSIETSLHFIPLHRHPVYKKKYGYSKKDFPVAEYIFARTVSLPLHNSISEEEVRRVCQTVCDFFEARE